jgi:hypothetical protein
MKSKLWTIATVIAAVVFVFGFVGCDDDDDNVNPTPQNFSVEIDDSYFSGADFYWIILHSASGVDSVIRLDEPGVADFGQIAVSRISWSKIRADSTSGYIIIESYLSAPPGNWLFSFDDSPYNESPYGSARINLTCPEGYYDHIRINIPLAGLYHGFSQSELMSTYSWLVNPRFLEADSTLSIVASIHTDNDELPAHIGWAFDQAFEVNRQNEFNIPLDKTLTPVAISYTRELTSLTIGGNRGESNVSLPIGYSPTEFDGTVYMIEDFPANNYDLYGRYSGIDLSYEYTLLSTETLPSVLPVPQTDIVYTETNGNITNIEITDGIADYLYCSWYLDTDPNAWSRYYWRVYTNENASEIARPILPPELVEEIGIEQEAMQMDCISLGEWSPLDGYDDYLRLMYIDKSSPEESSLATQCANYFYLTRRNPNVVFELPTDLQRILDFDRKKLMP